MPVKFTRYAKGEVHPKIKWGGGGGVVIRHSASQYLGSKNLLEDSIT